MFAVALELRLLRRILHRVYVHAMAFLLIRMRAGSYLDDLMSVVPPMDISWQRDAGSDFLINFYDWDRLVLNADADLNLVWHINLCTGVFPCVLTVVGDGNGRVRRSDNGSLTCLQSAGCMLFLKFKAPHWTLGT